MLQGAAEVKPLNVSNLLPLHQACTTQINTRTRRINAGHKIIDFSKQKLIFINAKKITLTEKNNNAKLTFRSKSVKDRRRGTTFKQTHDTNSASVSNPRFSEPETQVFTALQLPETRILKIKNFSVTQECQLRFEYSQTVAC